MAFAKRYMALVQTNALAHILCLPITFHVHQFVISHSMSTFIFFSARAFKTISLKHGSNEITCSKRSCANGCECCLYKAHCIECGFLLADFDETSPSCENDKVEISAYERIKVIIFMTETFHIMELE